MLFQVLKSFSYKHPVQDKARYLLQYGINIRLKRIPFFFLCYLRKKNQCCPLLFYLHHP